MTKRITVLDVPFDAVTEQEALDHLRSVHKQAHSRPFFVATPNPEMILSAQKDAEFKKILQQTDLNIADGTGILWAATYLDSIKKSDNNFIKIYKALKTLFYIPLSKHRIHKILPQRVTGTDLMQKLCAQPELKIFLLGAAEGVAEKAKSALEKAHRTNIVGTYAGGAAESEESPIRDMINRSGADVLFVAFGSPKQEVWLHRNLPFLHHLKLAIGIGGAFDFIAGVRKRAPKFMRVLGLEWLFRLIQQPSRINRIYAAVIKFPAAVIKSALQD